jgi:hypothetical protein
MSIANGHALDDGINTTRPTAGRRSPLLSNNVRLERLRIAR